jgi:hypothetical protein
MLSGTKEMQDHPENVAISEAYFIPLFPFNKGFR